VILSPSVFLSAPAIVPSNALHGDQRGAVAIASLAPDQFTPPGVYVNLPQQALRNHRADRRVIDAEVL
jgi:hypothetical protein